MARLRDLVVSALSLAALASAATACGTDATGTDACRRIEQARCRKAAAACPALGLRGDVGLRECVQYSRDRCLHGLAVQDPGPTVVAQCVTAIEQAATCDVVSAPETAPECAFLRPTPVPDAGADVPPDTTESDAGGG